MFITVNDLSHLDTIEHAGESKLNEEKLSYFDFEQTQSFGAQADSSTPVTSVHK
jgi:hypothetical protein